MRAHEESLRLGEPPAELRLHCESPEFQFPAEIVQGGVIYRKTERYVARDVHLNRDIGHEHCPAYGIGLDAKLAGPVRRGFGHRHWSEGQ